MKVTGVIAEFNPLHNGHEYFIREALRETGADHCVVVLSGDFTQRGVPAVCDKHLRTLMALRAGADIVIELPVMVSCASAEFFAGSGVFLLNALGIVTDIAFGTESGDISDLSSIADILLNEPDDYKKSLKEALKKGLSFPAARSEALLKMLPAIPDLQDLLSSPNNILAVEYLKMLKKLNSPISPVSIKRIGSGYNDDRIGSINSSALAIRNAIRATDSLSSLESEVPGHVFDLLSINLNKTLPVFTEDFSGLLRYSLLKASYSNTLEDYAGVSKSLSDRIQKNVGNYTDIDSFIQLIKTKDMTYSRILRALMHIMLEMKAPEEMLNEDNAYIRILGFRESASLLIKEINKHSIIPVISRLSDGPQMLTGKALETFNHDLFSTDIYNSVVEKKFGGKVTADLLRKLTNTDGLFTSV